MKLYLAEQVINEINAKFLAKGARALKKGVTKFATNVKTGANATKDAAKIIGSTAVKEVKKSPTATAIGALMGVGATDLLNMKRNRLGNKAIETQKYEEKINELKKKLDNLKSKKTLTDDEQKSLTQLQAAIKKLEMPKTPKKTA